MIDLAQNYPNPFNTSTSIPFTILLNSPVTIDIYNILGQHVKKLANKVYQAGVHTIQWNGIDKLYNPVASGVYICVLRSRYEIMSKKMVMLR